MLSLNPESAQSKNADSVFGDGTPSSESLIPPHLRELHFNLLKPKGKEAIEKDWPGRANYAYNDPKLLAHISNGGNYGVLAKANVLIIETDTRELAELVKTHLPATFTDRSPGHGCPHFYFKLAGLNGNLRTLPLFIQRNGAKENIGHLKYGNSYVVGPHCTHPNGGTYEIIEDQPLAQVTADQVLELLAPYITRKAHEAERVLAKEHHTALEFDITKIVGLDQFHRQGTEYYGAHPIHGSETGHNFWINPEKNNWFCFRCMSGGGPFQLLAVLEHVITCDRTDELRGNKFKKVLQIAREKGLLSNELSLETDPSEMAEFALAEMQLKTLADTKETLVYQDGVYIKGAEAVIAKWVEERLRDKELGKKATINFVREVLEHIKRRTYADRSKFDAEPFILNLRNGLLKVDTGEFKEHTPEYLSAVQIPTNYDPTAVCSKFRKFLPEITYKEDHPLLQETFGSTLWKDYPTKKATMLVGDGNNGKSTLIEVLKAMLGITNVSARNLQELEMNRFAKADLYGKLANLYADLSDSALKTVGTFKMLTGNDPLTAERKFQNSFTFINFAKLLFSCNKVPEVYEDTTAFFDRWNMITFPYTFTDSGPVADGGEKTKRANKNLRKELTTESELSGVLNWAIEGLNRLRANGWTFSNSRSTEELRDEYIRKSSPIHAFVLDCIFQKPDGRTPKPALFQAFCDYCTDHRLPIVTKNTFFQRLPEFVKVETQHPEIDGKRVWCMAGVELKPREQWGKKQEQVRLNDDSSGSLGGEESVHGVHPVPRLPDHVQDVQDVQGVSHLSPHSERLDLSQQEDREEALSRVRRLGPHYFKQLDEITEYLSIFCEPELAKRFVTELQQTGEIQNRPDGFWEVSQ